MLDSVYVYLIRTPSSLFSLSLGGKLARGILSETRCEIDSAPTNQRNNHAGRRKEYVKGQISLCFESLLRKEYIVQVQGAEYLHNSPQ